jgi:hypothetical protein
MAKTYYEDVRGVNEEFRIINPSEPGGSFVGTSAPRQPRGRFARPSPQKPRAAFLFFCG